jgi:hypothetical protein
LSYLLNEITNPSPAAIPRAGRGRRAGHVRHRGDKEFLSVRTHSAFDAGRTTQI